MSPFKLKASTIPPCSFCPISSNPRADDGKGFALFQDVMGIQAHRILLQLQLFLDPALNFVLGGNPPGGLDLSVDHPAGSPDDVVLHDFFDVRDLLNIASAPELGPRVQRPFLNFLATR